MVKGNIKVILTDHSVQLTLHLALNYVLRIHKQLILIGKKKRKKVNFPHSFINEQMY